MNSSIELYEATDQLTVTLILIKTIVFKMMLNYYKYSESILTYYGVQYFVFHLIVKICA